MNAIATMTSKGQVVIPQPIRDFFGLEPQDKLYFEVEDGKILVKPVLSIEKAMGIVKTKKFFTRRDYKETIAEAVAKKFRGK